MFSNLIPIVALVLAALRVTGNQVALSLSTSAAVENDFDALSTMLKSGGASTPDILSNLIMNSFSAQARKELMMKLLEQSDVVDVMRMMGHGEGLDAIRLLEVDGEMEPRLMTEGDKLRLKKDGHHFIDVTDHLDLGQINAQRTHVPAVPTTSQLANLKLVSSMFENLDDTHLRKDITKLTSFWNRSHRSRWGLLSSDWIHDQAELILKVYTSDAGVKTSVEKFHHPFFQNTIIARIESNNSSVASEDKNIIILSAHQDSINYLLPFYRAPGADDDGSGSVAILQVLRSLANPNISGHEHPPFVPPSHTALEFHWYAGEEGGLLGSQAVAAAYEKAGKKVKGVLHMDMTAFLKKGTTPIVAFFREHTNKNLTTFTTQLADEYLDVGWNMTDFPWKGAGSDHMSWTKAGYPAVFIAEGLFENFQPNVHTIYDDLESDGQYSFKHMLHFVKLGISFVLELSSVVS